MNHWFCIYNCVEVTQKLRIAFLSCDFGSAEPVSQNIQFLDLIFITHHHHHRYADEDKSCSEYLIVLSYCFGGLRANTGLIPSPTLLP